MAAKQPENIALFDMDGTLCDFEGQLLRDLERLRGPDEPKLEVWTHTKPDYIQARIDIITASQQWWQNLPKLQLGWDVMKIAEDLGYKIMILTQGPRRNPAAWIGKKLWIDKNLGPDVDITITRDKGLVYGKVLVDDYPAYVERWLTWRKNGLVIMPASDMNKGYEHSQVVRYDGSNQDRIKEVLEKRLNTASDIA